METYSSINAYGYHSPYQYDPHLLHWCSRCPSSTEWVLPSYSPPTPHPFPQPYLWTPPPAPYPPFPPPVPEQPLPQEIIYAEWIDDETKMKVPVSVHIYSDMTAEVMFDEMPHCRSTIFAAQQANHKPDILEFEHSTAAAVPSELNPDLDDNDTEEASIDSKPLVFAIRDTKPKIKWREALSIDSNFTDQEVKCDSLLLDCIREIDSATVPFNTWMGMCLNFEKSGAASSLFDKMLDNNGKYSYSLISKKVSAPQMLHHFPFDPGSAAGLVFDTVPLVFDNGPQYLTCTALVAMSAVEFGKNRMVCIADQVFNSMSQHGCCSKVLLDEPSVAKLLILVILSSLDTVPELFDRSSQINKKKSLDSLLRKESLLSFGGQVSSVLTALRHCLHNYPYLREIFEAILGATRDILCVMRSCVQPKKQTEVGPIMFRHDFDSSYLEWCYTLPLIEDGGWETWTVDILGWGSFALDRSALCVVASNCDNLYSLWTTDIKRPMAEAVIVIERNRGCLCCVGFNSRHDHDVLQLERRDVAGDATHCFDIEGCKVDYGTSLLSGFHSSCSQETQLALVLDAWVKSNPCTNYNSWMVCVPKGEFFSSIDPTKCFKDLEEYTELESVKEWKKYLDTILPTLATARALPSLSIRGNLDVLATNAARYKPSLLESFDPMGHQRTLGATKLRMHFSGIINSLGVKDLLIHSWILIIYNFEEMSAGNLLDLIKINDVVGKYFYELLFHSKDGNFYARFALAMLFPTLQLSIQRDVAAHVMTTVSVSTYGVYSFVEGENLKATVVHDDMVVQGIKPNTLIVTSLVHGFFNECKLLEDGFVSGAGRILLKVRPILRFVVNCEMPSYGEQLDTVYSGTMNSNFSNAGNGIQESTSKLLLVDGVDHKDFQFLYQRIVSPVTSRDYFNHWSSDFVNNTTSMLFASSSPLTYFLNSVEKRKTCRHQEVEKAIFACFVEMSCIEPAPNRVTYHWVILACKFAGLSAEGLHYFDLLVESMFEHKKATTRGSLVRDFGEHKKIKEGDDVYCAMPDLNFTTITLMVTKTGWPLKGDSNKPAATRGNAKFNNSNLWEQVLNNSRTSTHPVQVKNVLNFIMLLMSNKCWRNQRCNWLIAGAVDVLVEKVLAGLHGLNLEDKVLFQDGRNVMNATKLADPFGKMSNYIWDPGKIVYI